MSKLGLKIFIIFILVSIGGLLITSIYINYRFDFYFENYLKDIRKSKVSNLKNLLEDSYDQLNNWNEARNIIGNFASLNDFRVVLRDNNGEIIAFSSPNMFGRMNQNMMGRMSEHTANTPDINLQNYEMTELHSSGNKVGELLWQRSRVEEIVSNNEDVFMNQINRVIYIAAFITALLVIAATYFFSKYLTNSLNKMNKVVKEVADGNLDQEINIKTNDEVAELGNSFNQMVRKLRYLEKIRKESASDLAHELRTPLSNIRNYLEGFEDDVLEWNTQTYEEINEELERLIKLVNRLNELNEAEAKILNVDKQLFNLEKLVNKIVKNYKLSAQDKNIDFNIEIANNKKIYADKNAIKQIFNNLISNALKYSFEGENISIKIKELTENYEITISNKGPKIDKEDLPYLFERFYRADKSRSQKNGGLGIGLAITRNLVEAHGGSIEVESDNDLTIFRITLPNTK
ncbi:MAG: HAMP domain-containing histidine kinase [Halanaerobiales bacterium]|nr:HAMP domain-containing histidine kinase [Halanaerobiales bacterium]